MARLSQCDTDTFTCCFVFAAKPITADRFDFFLVRFCVKVTVCSNSCFYFIIPLFFLVIIYVEIFIGFLTLLSYIQMNGASNPSISDVFMIQDVIVWLWFISVWVKCFQSIKEFN